MDRRLSCLRVFTVAARHLSLSEHAWLALVFSAEAAPAAFTACSALKQLLCWWHDLGDSHHQASAYYHQSAASLHCAGSRASSSIWIL